MSARSVVVVSAGLGTPSSTRLLADRLAASVSAALDGVGEPVTLTHVELRELAHDLTGALLSGFPSPDLRSVQEAVAEADALVVVTPVFSGSYSGLFKTFFDVLDQGALRGKPVLLAATAGSPRHSLVLEHALRPLFSYLGAWTLPTAVFAAGEDWGDTSAGALTDRVDRAAGELAGLLSGRPAPAPVDPFDSVTPFEQLLRPSPR